MVLRLFDKQLDLVIKLIIVFLIRASIYTEVVAPMMASALNVAIQIAQALNYIITAQALQLWQNTESSILGLLVILMLIDLVSEEFDKNLLKSFMYYPIESIILAALFFNLSLPVIIEYKIIPDWILASILYILSIGSILTTLYLLVSKLDNKI